MRILALPGGDPGKGSTDYRAVFPLRHLERQFGVEYEISPSADLNKISRFDLILFQRQEMPVIEKVIRAAHRFGKKAIFDIDDDAFNIPWTNPNYCLWGTDWRKVASVVAGAQDRFAEEGKTPPEYLRVSPLEAAQRARGNLRQLLRNIGAADALTVTTSWLDQVYAKHQRRRYILPNYVEPEEWEGMGPEPHEGIHLGWAGGPTHYEDLKTIAGPVQQIMEEYPQTKLVLAGYPIMKDFLFERVPEGRIIARPFVRPGWRQNLTTFDIVLAPSAANKFNRGKSAIRVYQGLLATRGKAAVIGSETTYGDTIRRLGCGYACKNTKDWLRALKRLIEDPSRRQDMGAVGYERMMASETYGHNAYRWMDCYEEVLGD